MSPKYWDQSDHRLLWHYIENFLTRFTTLPCHVWFLRTKTIVTDIWLTRRTDIRIIWLIWLFRRTNIYIWPIWLIRRTQICLDVVSVTEVIIHNFQVMYARDWTNQLTTLGHPYLNCAYHTIPAGNTCVIMPSGHFKRGWLTSCTKTTDPILTSQRPAVPFQGGRLRI